MDTPSTTTLTRVRASVGLLTLLLLLTVGWLLPVAPAAQAHGTETAVTTVESVGMTVSDMDAALAFYVNVLNCTPISDVEVSGQQYEHLQGVFGLRMRVVRLAIGDEILELTEYLAPRGRPIPAHARSNDRSFQHITIIVRDMDEAYSWLRQHRVQHASTSLQTIPEWNVSAAGICAFYFHDPDGHTLEVLSSHLTRARRSGRLGTGCSWASTTRPLSWATPTRACSSTVTRSGCRWPGPARTMAPSRST